jgi:hypothetical protein
MATYGEWIKKSARIGALLGGVAGFFYGAYIMATNLTLGWTDVLDTVGSVVAVLIFSVILGSLCIAIGGLAGLVLGVVDEGRGVGRISSCGLSAKILFERLCEGMMPEEGIKYAANENSGCAGQKAHGFYSRYILCGRPGVRAGRAEGVGRNPV